MFAWFQIKFQTSGNTDCTSNKWSKSFNNKY